MTLCNGYEDGYIDCGSHGTNRFPAIYAKCNGSDTRAPLGFMLSEFVATEPVHLNNQNYFWLEW